MASMTAASQTQLEFWDLRKSPLALRRAFVYAMNRDSDAEGLDVLIDAHRREQGQAGSLGTHTETLTELLAWCRRHHRNLLTLNHAQAEAFVREVKPDREMVQITAAELYAALVWSGVEASNPFDGAAPLGRTE